MTQNEINLQEWENPGNWKWGSFYNSEKDSRVWVCKKTKWMGWTLNFAKNEVMRGCFSYCLYLWR